ncbi:MAG TPA: class I SAM-dependent methyltransferase [Gemmatimonadaceae bacterium]|nr:class I SAM-dependent methyltransferase [Gemmatimonadaceae bacterium]
MKTSDDTRLKDAVRAFWDEASCGEVYAVGDSERERLDNQEAARYALEPYIFEFARFDEGRDRDVLEIGVGMGADHLQWARARPRSLSGVDLTPRAIAHCRDRLAQRGLHSELKVGDAEALPFEAASFDIVYSWGVLHHSPDTPAAIREVHRVLRAGGEARIMVYHTWAIVGYMLWVRYALLALRPWRSLRSIYAEHLESPGTKAYSADEARQLFSMFSEVEVSSQLSVGDLMEGAAGQRHGGPLLRLARRVWPRAIIRRVLPGQGLFLLITARK